MHSARQSDPLVTNIFENKQWFGDGPPHWTVGRHHTPFDTAQEALRQRGETTNLLYKHGAETPEAVQLADHIETCSKHTPCTSAACPLCARAFTRWFVSAGSEVLREIESDILVLSIVPADQSVPIGELTPDALTMTGKMIVSTFRKLEVTPALITIDLSANECRDGLFETHYQPQAWVFAPADQLQGLGKDLRKAFPRNATVRRPVKILPWDGNLAALAYGLKGQFVRRVSYWKESLDGERKRHRNTRDRALRNAQKVETLLTLDKGGFRSRLHLIGARLTRTSRGTKMRLINPAS